MVKELRTAILVVLATAALLAACAPAQTSPEQVQSTIATSVAMTVESQNNMALAVVQTLTAQAPLPSPTASLTPIALALPADPALATATPFVVVPPSGGSAGGNSAADPVSYACSWREVKPKINVFKPGDPIDVVWIITNTGTKAWPSKKDLDFTSGTKMSPFVGEELPPLKSDETVTISFEANAPTKPGFYEMKFKVEGGLCFPALDIEVGKPKDP
jgi:predicted small secreted protein